MYRDIPIDLPRNALYDKPSGKAPPPDPQWEARLANVRFLHYSEATFELLRHQPGPDSR